MSETKPALVLLQGPDGPAVDHHWRTIEISPNGKLINVVIDDPNAEAKCGTELYGVNWSEFDQITGRILTLCDATFSDPEQRKAFKDMVRQNIKEWTTQIVVNAAADAGSPRVITAPFVGGVFDNPDLFWGVEGQPTR